MRFRKITTLFSLSPLRERVGVRGNPAPQVFLGASMFGATLAQKPCSVCGKLSSSGRASMRSIKNI